MNYKLLLCCGLNSWLEGCGIPPLEHTCERVPWDHLWPLGVGSLIGGGVVVLLLLALLWLTNKRYRSFARLANLRLTWAFVGVWLAGFVTYDVGMYTGAPSSLLGNMPMAILHAFGIFLLDSDVSAIHEPFHNNEVFMFFFSVTHLAAAVVSMLFVIKHFGFNIVAEVRLFFASLFSRRRQATYVFWGLNDASYCLAESINRHHRQDGQLAHRVIVVRTEAAGNKTSDRNAMERLFNFVKMNDRDVDRLHRLGCLTTSTFAHPSLDGDVADTDFLRRTMRLRRVARLIKRTSGELHIFFMSDLENDNVVMADMLSADKTIHDFLENGDKTQRATFYCHARYNSVHRVIEDRQYHERLQVKVIDSSRLTADLLKKDSDLHPANFVDVQPDATVSSTFRALVVGFGEVGQDVVRFLYEFGAFAGQWSTPHQVRRAPFRCDVVDRGMADLAGRFVANAPAVAPAMPFLSGQPMARACLTLHQMDCDSVDFYRHLVDEWIGQLNYVVLATGDDELNVNMAVRIFRLAMRYKDTLWGDRGKRFRILVRVHGDAGGFYDKIRRHYNTLCQAQRHCDGDSHQRQVTLHSEGLPQTIILFGTDSQIYTYDQVVGDQTLQRAKTFKQRYDQRYAADKPRPDWDGERRDIMQLTDEYLCREQQCHYYPTMSGVMWLRRTQCQNFANSLHEATKALLARAALGEYYPLLAQWKLTRPADSIVYEKPEQMQQEDFDRLTAVLDTLAWTEHLRWNAAHEILGYRLGAKDEVRLLHNCLCSWQDLPDDATRSYDYNVVDLTRWQSMGGADDTTAPQNSGEA